MKVLFAVSNERISESIAKKYQQEYKEIISSKNVYYFNAIIKELQKDKSYDRIVISEDLEMFASDNYQEIDKFIFEKLDSISDEASNGFGGEIPIILICTDRRTKRDPLMLRLFGIGIYSALLSQDRSIQKVSELIYKPRSKKEAKAYYKVESKNVQYKSEAPSNGVSELEIQNILMHYRKISDNPEKCAESFKRIVNQYTEEQLKIIISVLPMEIKMILEANSDEYLNITGKKVGNEENKRKSSMRASVIERKQDFIEKNISKTNLANPVIIPTQLNTDKIKKMGQDLLEKEEKKKVERQREAEEKAREEAEKKVAEEKAKRQIDEERLRIAAERKVTEERARRMEAKKLAEEKAKKEALKKAAEMKVRIEAEKKAAEEKARMEAEKKAAEEKARIEAEKKAAEEKARMEAEKKAAEEKARMEAEKKAAEEKARIEAEKKAAEEKARIEAEKKAAEEKARMEAEKKAAEEKARMEAEKKAAEEKARIEAEKKAREEKARIEAEKKAAEEKARIEAEKKAVEEKARMEAEKKATEEKARIEAEKKAAEEKARIEAEKKAAEEKARIEAEKKAAEEKAKKEAEEKTESVEIVVVEKRKRGRPRKKPIETLIEEDSKNKLIDKSPEVEDSTENMEDSGNTSNESLVTPIVSIDDDDFFDFKDFNSLDEIELGSVSEIEDSLDDEGKSHMKKLSLDDDEDELEELTWEEEYDDIAEEDDELEELPLEYEEENIEELSLEDEEDSNLEDLDLFEIDDIDSDYETEEDADETDLEELPLEDEEDDLEELTWEAEEYNDEEDEEEYDELEELPLEYEEEDIEELPLDDEEDSNLEDLDLFEIDDIDSDYETEEDTDETDLEELPLYDDEDELEELTWEDEEYNELDDEEDIEELPLDEEEDSDLEDLDVFEIDDIDSGYETEEDTDETDIEELPLEDQLEELPLEDEEEDFGNLPDYEDDDSDDMIQKIMDQINVGEIQNKNLGKATQINARNLNIDIEENEPIKTIKAIENTTNKPNLIIDNLITGDKKIVSFVGTTKNGTSFVINNLAKMFSEKGIKTAVLDLTQNRNAYYIYTENEEELRKKAYTCLENLTKGIADGIQVNKNLTIYTSLPGETDNLKDGNAIIETLLKEYSLILLDCDFNTEQFYFKVAQETYLVQSLDVLTIQPLTAFLRELKINNMLEPEKLRIIINKSIKVNGISEKIIIGGMSVYNDPGMTYMTELFDRNKIKYVTIPFEEQIYANYLESLAKCKINYKKSSKKFLTSLNNLGNMVYPLLNGRPIKKGKAFNNFDNNFSDGMNDTLKKMKSKY